MEKSKQKFDTMCVFSAGNGGGSLVGAAHPCCLMLSPSMAHRLPSTARTNCPRHATGVRRRPPPLSLAARRRRSPPAHTPAKLTTTQGANQPTNQPINQSIKPAIILPNLKPSPETSRKSICCWAPGGCF